MGIVNITWDVVVELSWLSRMGPRRHLGSRSCGFGPTFQFHHVPACYSLALWTTHGHGFMLSELGNL